VNWRSIAVFSFKSAFIVGIAAYLLIGIDLQAIWLSLQGYAFSGLLLAATSALLSYIAIAWRWHQISAGTCNLRASFEATIIRAFLNLILPARAGEISKLAYLKTRYKLELNRGVSMLFIERFADIILLTVLMLLASLFVIGGGYLQNLSLILLAALLGLFWLLRSPLLPWMIGKVPVRSVRVLGKQTLRRIRQLMQPALAARCTVSTSLIWLLYFGVTYAFFAMATDFDLNAGAILVIFVVSSVAMSIPLTPGGIGTYQASIVVTAGAYGVDKSSALAASIALHSIVFVVSGLLFAALLAREHLTIGEITEDAKHLQDEQQR
jgi:uncharacterized membrane protein YbhN (UPF0104 family)